MCDVQRRFSDFNYPSDNLLRQIANAEQSLEDSQDIQLLQDMQLGSEFGLLDGNKLAAFYAHGVDLVASIVNTARCSDSG